MKAFFRNSIYAIAALSIFSCEEKNDLIYLGEGNQIYLQSATIEAVEAPQQKNVLIEDFTGVRCVNCPKAQKEAEDISHLHPGRIVINAIHVTDFAKPYAGSDYDFRTTDGNNLTILMGDPGALPKGSIDRTISSTTGTYFTLYNQWRAQVSGQLGKETPVNISFTKKNYDEATRTLEMNMKVAFTKEVNDSLYLSANILESGMVDVQETPNGKDSNYVHKHVLRAYLHPFNGFYLGNKHEKGKTYNLSFNMKLPEQWIADSCHVNAKVHYRGRNNLDILQVQETGLK